LGERIEIVHGPDDNWRRRERHVCQRGERDWGTNAAISLQGSVAGDLISFTVNWGETITTWIGHGVVDNGAPGILTLWHLVLTIPDETDPQKQWKTVMAGADEFVR